MMAGSYERINYSLRPAKTIERKMLCQAFRRLFPFGEVSEYRYVGFGSTYFSDFILLHRSLGIRNMISIERDVQNKRRFVFNRPFSCIDIHFGDSSMILPTLSWDVRTILWLDYDGPLDQEGLADIACFCASSCPGSVLVVTVNAHPDRSRGIPMDDVDRLAAYRLEMLERSVGREKVPRDVEGRQDLAGWGKARISRRIISNEIAEILKQRNGGRSPGSQIRYEQLFYFHYADGAKMMTTGGLLYDEGQSPHVSRCNFGALPFVRSGGEPYQIDVPSLTYREIRHLESQLPVEDCSTLDAPDIPQSHLEMYSRVYKYFPTFAEADI